jgi:hypothetical protein
MKKVFDYSEVFTNQGVKQMKVRLTFTEELLGTASGNRKVHTDYIASKAPDAPNRPAKIEEEIRAIGEDEVLEKSMTIFPRNADGEPILWDYQIKGFFKDACSMLGRCAGTKSSQLTAHKKIIDGVIFTAPRQIVLVPPPGQLLGEVDRPLRCEATSPDEAPGKLTTGHCERPLRADTAQGPRIALAHSETAPAGTTCDVEISYMELLNKSERIPKKTSTVLTEGFGTLADLDPTKPKPKPEPKAKVEKVRLGDCIMEWLEYGKLRGLGQWRNSGKGRFTFEILEP